MILTGLQADSAANLDQLQRVIGTHEGFENRLVDLDEMTRGDSVEFDLPKTPSTCVCGEEHLGKRAVIGKRVDEAGVPRATVIDSDHKLRSPNHLRCQDFAEATTSRKELPFWTCYRLDRVAQHA